MGIFDELISWSFLNSHCCVHFQSNLVGFEPWGCSIELWNLLWVTHVANYGLLQLLRVDLARLNGF